MRSSKSRSRSKSNRQRTIGNIINRVFDSSGPEGKVRGTPQQIIEKYLMLARDAQLSNDRVAEQSFLQHAEHYTRLLGEAQREMAREQEQRQGQPGQGSYGSGNGNGNGYSQPRERVELQPDTGEQPDLPPLPEVSDDEGPGLVETPEARSPRPERAERGDRSDRPERAERSDRGDRPERKPQTEAAPQGGEQTGEKSSRSSSRNRGPRKPRPQGEAGEAALPSAPESGDAPQ